MKIHFDHRKQLAPDIWQHFFILERRPDYQPGQYAEFLIPELTQDERGNSRTFTLTSVPADPFVSFVDKYSRPASRFKHTLHSLIAGQEIYMSDPLGDLVLPMDDTIPLLFIAGGIGIASYVGMVQSLLDMHESRSVTLLYTVKSASDIILQDVFIHYGLEHALRSELFITNESGKYDSNYPGELANQRRLQAYDVLKYMSPETLLYISGTETMVESLRQELLQRGVSNQKIIFDYFDGYITL